MDNVSENELELKKILVDLDYKQNLLQATVDHLENEIKKREIEVQKLLSERGLRFAKKSYSAEDSKDTKSIPPAQQQRANDEIVEFNSEFARELAFLLNNIGKNSEEITKLIKL